MSSYASLSAPGSALAPAHSGAPASGHPGTPAPERPGVERKASGELAAAAATYALKAAPTLLIAAALCLITFLAGGGLSLEPTTKVEMGITIGSGLIAAAAILLAPARRRINGGWAAGLLLAFASLSAISIAWSVTPDASWQDAGRMFAYSALFVAALALARAAPDRWNAVLGGVVIAAFVICGYALLTKVLPNHLDPSDPYARLRAPYGYWNATGLAAAMGIVACLWLGARRSGHALLSALAYPACGLLMVTLMLAYSRGSLAVAAIGVAVWMCLVPLRLRGAALLVVSGACAAVVVAFDFSESALSSEGVALAQRTAAGHRLGVLLAAMLIVLTISGIAIGFTTGRKAPSRAVRRRLGAALIAALVLAVIAGVGALALSERGLTGTISHDFSALTNPNAPVPANTPGRLTSVGSVRARYWKEAIQVFEEHPALGAGAEGYATARLRFQAGSVTVAQAHGYLVQTLADLGAVGLALTLALLVAWLIAAGKATHPFNRRWSGWRWRRFELPYSPERIGLLSMLCIVIAFGVHSLEDWTWYVPGTACIALLCAGWLAGRGALEEGAQRPPVRWRHLQAGRIGWDRIAAAGAMLLAALMIAWAQWQPLRSSEASQQALSLAAASPQAALSAARSAVSRDPLSAQALFTLSAVQQRLGQEGPARATLRRAVKMQPANPEAWLTLGIYDLNRDPKAAVRELGAALYLNPQSITAKNEYVLALRAVQAGPATTSQAGTGSQGTSSQGTGSQGTGGTSARAKAEGANGKLRTARASHSRAALHALLGSLRHS